MPNRFKFISPENAATVFKGLPTSAWLSCRGVTIHWSSVHYCKPASILRFFCGLALGARTVRSCIEACFTPTLAGHCHPVPRHPASRDVRMRGTIISRPMKTVSLFIVRMPFYLGPTTPAGRPRCPDVTNCTPLRTWVAKEGIADHGFYHAFVAEFARPLQLKFSHLAFGSLRCDAQIMQSG